MKRALLVLLLFAGTASALYPENIESNYTQTLKAKYALSVNLVGPIYDFYSVNFEMAVTKNISLMVIPTFSPDLGWSTGSIVLGINLEARYYPFDSNISGLYAGIAAGANFYSGGLDYSALWYKVSYSGIIPLISLDVGYKWAFSSGFFIEPFIGYQIGIGSVSVGTADITTGQPITNYNGIIPAAGGLWYGLNTGWAF